MRLRLFLLLVLVAALPALAQKATVSGTVVDAITGAPIPGASVGLNGQGARVATGPSGNFTISTAKPGEDVLTIAAKGYYDLALQVQIVAGAAENLGLLRLDSSDLSGDYYESQNEMYFDEATLDDDDSGSAQSISALTGASDDIYYRTASYNFSPMYFNYRGYNSRYQDVYVNGLKMNDLMRGRFNFSSFMGMTSRAFRNKTTTIGIGASGYGFGNIGGSSNYNTITSTYSPGFNASVAYTNSAYMMRAMATYSTGINRNGWGLTVSAIARYAPEGVIEGTFYNSGGIFLSLEKEFSLNNSLTLTFWGGPTQRATATATYQEAYDLAGSNLYNPNWGWQDGKKRSASIRNSFDPTLTLNWLWKNEKTTLNTAVGIRFVNYSSSALNWFNANDPRPNYYRNLPSYWAYSGFDDVAAEIAEQWRNNEAYRQIDWDRLYEINYRNNYENRGVADADRIGSSYILEDRHSNQFNFLANSYLDRRLTDHMTLQAGVSFNYTSASYYKTIRDLLGGEFWLDVDPFSDDLVGFDPDKWQNNLDDPNRRVGKGDRFGYDYRINAIQAQAWLQNVINLNRWDINYGVQLSYTQYQRDGKMRNGRAPENSLGKGKIARFDDASAKVGVTYKIDGRNFIMFHGLYGTQAPVAENIFISPRIKDTMASNLQSERILSADLSYNWNYRRFRGSIAAYYTYVDNAMEHSAFYDDNLSTFVNYTLQGVAQKYKGLELGMSYKITPSIQATFAGTYSRSQYANNPEGTRSAENGMEEDATRTVYLKNYYLGSTPQTAANLGVDWQAPHRWFFNINGTIQADSYVNLGIPYHEEFTDLWQQYPTLEQMEDKIKQLTEQERLKSAFTLNLSVGKLIYLNRKMSLNLNLNIYNVLNNRNIVTYAYQQSRIRTSDWNPSYYANRYSYAQGIRVFFNVGLRF